MHIIHFHRGERRRKRKGKFKLWNPKGIRVARTGKSTRDKHGRRVPVYGAFHSARGKWLSRNGGFTTKGASNSLFSTSRGKIRSR